MARLAATHLCETELHWFARRHDLLQAGVTLILARVDFDDLPLSLYHEVKLLPDQVLRPPDALHLAPRHQRARLSTDTTAQYPIVPWSVIKRVRDRLAYRDEGTDYGAVWDTLVVDLPTIRGYLAGVAEAGW